MKNASLLLAAAFLGALVSQGFSNPQSAWASPMMLRAEEEGTLMRTGGSEADKMDLCWVMDRKAGESGKVETRLALYKAIGTGPNVSLTLAQIRLIDYDLKLVQLKETKPTVQQVKKTYEQDKKKQEKTK